MIRESVKSSVDVHVQSGIDERTGITLDIVVVPFAFGVQRGLLHVRLPVDLSVLMVSVQFPTLTDFNP